MNRIPSFAVIFFVCAGLFFSCKKESFITGPGAALSISADSLHFDTVFTTTGSVTQSFKIFNNNSQKLLLSSVKLGGGASSAYKMNVNGAPGNEIDNITIAANDSIYVFVSVTVNPSTANLPFVISDSLSVNYNGQTQLVHLEAYGQNANFIRNGIITGNTVFTNTLPYVILGGLQVTATGFLTINAGTKIYCHADAPILVDGKLVCAGTKAQPVIFNGDRLDDPYKDFPASWPGIIFHATCKDNFLQFTDVKNAYQAIVVQQPSVNANPKLIIKQCIIDNAFDAGILCSNSSVTADNTLISNCGKNIRVEQGGTYSFTHCTSAAYSTDFVLHKAPAVYLSDINDAGQAAPLTVLLRNCILYGDQGFIDDEVQTNKQSSNSFNVTIDHCLYRALNDPANTSIITSIKNQDPSFDSLDIQHHYFDFHITKNSAAPGIDNGVATSLLKDLDDNNRNVGLPDLGAYEKQ
jgi:hypothetical protein